MTLKVGLTGGIGSGKSKVSELFQEYGVPVIDADVVARSLLRPGQPAFASVVKHFGASIVNEDGSLNRMALREAIFAEPKKRQALNAIMHPRIYSAIDDEVVLLDSPYCIIAIPLLLETRANPVVDRILVVDCPLDQQIRRVIARDKVSDQQVRAIIASQIDRQQRLAHADDIIDNAGTERHLAEQVKSLHNFYIELATVRTSRA